MPQFALFDPSLRDGLDISLQIAAGGDAICLDGVCATRQINAVQVSRVTDKMTGTHWRLHRMPDGYWTICNQAQQDYLLSVAEQNKLALWPINSSWPDTHLQWRLITDPETGTSLLRNRAGGGYLRWDGGHLGIASLTHADDTAFQWRLTAPIPLGLSPKVKLQRRLSLPYRLVRDAQRALRRSSPASE